MDILKIIKILNEYKCTITIEDFQMEIINEEGRILGSVDINKKSDILSNTLLLVNLEDPHMWDELDKLREV